MLKSKIKDENVINQIRLILLIMVNIMSILFSSSWIGSDFIESSRKDYPDFLVHLTGFLSLYIIFETFALQQQNSSYLYFIIYYPFLIIAIIYIVVYIFALCASWN